MPEYDSTRFDPPAPLARVSLRNPDTGKTVSDIPMLVDSGADASLVPRATIDVLNLRVDSNKTYALEGFDGQTSIAQIVHADMLFLGRTLRGRYLLLDSEIGILGRDVLITLS